MLVGSQSSRTALRGLLVSGLVSRSDKRWKMLHLEHLGAFSHCLSLFCFFKLDRSFYSQPETRKALDKSHFLFHGECFGCKILNLSRLLDFFFLVVLKLKDKHALMKLHKRTHSGFLSYQVAQAGQRFVLERGKKLLLLWIVHANVLCRTLCAHKDSFSFIFLVFGAL